MQLHSTAIRGPLLLLLLIVSAAAAAEAAAAAAAGADKLLAFTCTVHLSPVYL